MNTAKITTIFHGFHLDAELKPIEFNLSLVYQKRYEFMTLTVNAKEFLMIKEKRSGSLENFVKQAQVIERQLNQDVILIFSKLSDEQKKKLLQAGIPYLDYQENTYIPQLGFIFSSMKQKNDVKKPLTATEQKVLIALLLYSSGLMIDIADISRLTHLAIPSLYRTFKQFKERGWLTNKQKSYQFAKQKQLIFDEAKMFLKNPIREVITISDNHFQKLNQEVPLKISHLQALSYIGMIAYDDENGMYALSNKQYRHIEKELQSHIFKGHRIEIWNYEPIYFDYQQQAWLDDAHVLMVDPISLYLILKDDEDPRIEEEIEHLEHKILNMLGGKYAS